ncbi:L,D-transpeptidase family protein [Hoeflea sp. G2-23]|uniref:L,D-transpeptidase family protein n=1 Tax=Hoeflea algicola TaxID=2983763 RepID=A0ABT3ZBH7_9HYPH|nr:L,D-transpeptidase family protein [Hoeflea algicola]MCY0148996.1 L,D-transpeptidase family protein [Hoeflea algicola]
MVRRSPLNPLRAVVRFGPLSFSAALGRGGVRTFKREGDGATPRGLMSVVSGFRSGSKRFAVPSPVALRRVGRRDGWCDAPAHGAYNRAVRLPFAASHETLIRSDALYDAVLVLNWNYQSRARGRGSAIFMHVARPGYAPTEGCVALKWRDLVRLLKVIRRGDVVRVV